MKVERGIYVVTHDVNWNKLGMSLAIYSKGRFYDQFVVEDDQMPIEDWDVTDVIDSYEYTGKKYRKNI